MTSVKNIEPEEFEQIEKYLLGKMNPEEQTNFESTRDNDAVLRQKVEEYRTPIQAVQAGSLKESLNDIHQKTIDASTSSRTNWFAIAAGILILISISFWVLNRKTPAERLFAEYVTTDPGLPVPMSATSGYKFHDAMVDYKAEKYDLAIKKWTLQLATDSGENGLNYYIGSAYFNLGNYTEALPYFAKASSQKMGDFQAKAQWYQVLTWLKLDKTSEVLQTNPLPNSPYSERIELIQNQLKR